MSGLVQHLAVWRTQFMTTLLPYLCAHVCEACSQHTRKPAQRPEIATAAKTNRRPFFAHTFIQMFYQLPTMWEIGYGDRAPERWASTQIYKEHKL